MINRMMSDNARVESILRLISLIVAIFIIAGLFYFGAKPGAVGLFRPPWDKVAHFVTFGSIAGLLWYALFRGHPLLVVVIVSAVGVADELHQRTLPGRIAGLDDLAADILAAIVIASLLEWLRRRKS